MEVTLKMLLLLLIASCSVWGPRFSLCSFPSQKSAFYEDYADEYSEIVTGESIFAAAPKTSNSDDKSSPSIGVFEPSFRRHSRSKSSNRRHQSISEDEDEEGEELRVESRRRRRDFRYTSNADADDRLENLEKDRSEDLSPDNASPTSSPSVGPSTFSSTTATTFNSHPDTGPSRKTSHIRRRNSRSANMSPPAPTSSLFSASSSSSSSTPSTEFFPSSNVPLKFEPPVLVYANSTTCIPVVSEFTITNVLQEEVGIYSMRSDNPQFHPVNFQPQVLAAGESINVYLLFLPHYVEVATATLTFDIKIGGNVGTDGVTDGTMLYMVEGHSRHNPYRLRPLIGHNIPAGLMQPYEQPILIFNPHNEPLYIREIFTTESFLSLKGIDNMQPNEASSSNGVQNNAAFLSGSSLVSAEESTWMVKPGVEQQLIIVKMTSGPPGNYSGYVHVKTNKDNIVLPVGLHVMGGGLYPRSSHLDFGVMTSVAQKVTLELWLSNSGAADAYIDDIMPSTPDPNLSIEFVDRLIEADSDEEVLVATLTYTANKPGQVKNNLLVIANNSNPALGILTIPYEVSVLHGGIGFEMPRALFILPIRNVTCNENSLLSSSTTSTTSSNASNNLHGSTSREFIFTNYFSSPVALQLISLATCGDLLSVTEDPIHTDPIPSLQKWPPITINFNVDVTTRAIQRSPDLLPFTCWLELWTNVSSHRIPLHIIDGSIKLSYMDAQMLDDINSYSPRTKVEFLSSSQFTHLCEHEDPVEMLESNSDVYHIDLKSISSFEPRPLRLAFTNNNPVKINLSLVKASHDLCVCFEASWPQGANDDDTALDHMFKVVDRSFLQAQKDSQRCSCFINGEDITFLHSIGANDDAQNGNDNITLMNTYNSVNGEIIETTPNIGNISNGFTSKTVNDIDSHSLSITEVKAGYTSLFSVIFPPMIFSEILTNTSSNGSDLLPFDGGLESHNVVSFTLGSPYQRIHSFLHMKLSNTRIESVMVSQNAKGPRFATDSFTIGIKNALQIMTRAFDQLLVDDLTMKVVPNLFTLMSSLNNIPLGDVVSSWQTLLLPTFDCFVQSGSITPTGGLPFTWSGGSIWLCSREVLLQLSTSSPEFDSYQGILRRLEGIDTIMQSNQYALFFREVAELQNEWANYFLRGIPVPKVDMLVYTPSSLHRHTLDNITIQSPLSSIPLLSSVTLPKSHMDESTFFFIRIFNPFDIVVSFSMKEISSPSSAQSDSILGDILSSFDSDYKKNSNPVNTLVKYALEGSLLEINATYTFASDIDSKAALDRIDAATPVADREADSDGKNLVDDIWGVSEEAGRIIGNDHGRAENSKENARHGMRLKRSNSPYTITKLQPGISSNQKDEKIIRRKKEWQEKKRNRDSSIREEISFIRGVVTMRPIVIETQAMSKVLSTAEDPFVVHSLSSNEMIALPHTSLVIGPIAFVPRAADIYDNEDDQSNGGVASVFHSRLFVVSNNLTGIDMLEVQAESGIHKLTPQSISSVTSSSSGLGLSVVEPTKNSTDTCLASSSSNSGHSINECSSEYTKTLNSSAQFNSTIHNHSKSANIYAAADVYNASVEFNHSDNRPMISFRNDGTLPAVVKDIIIDGTSVCTYTSHLSTLLPSFLHGSDFNLKKSHVYDLCQLLPIEVDPKYSWHFEIPHIVSCFYFNKQIKVQLVFGSSSFPKDSNERGRARRLHAERDGIPTIGESLNLVVLPHLSLSYLAQCESQSNSFLLNFLCYIISIASIIVGIVQVLPFISMRSSKFPKGGGRVIRKFKGLNGVSTKKASMGGDLNELEDDDDDQQVSSHTPSPGCGNLPKSKITPSGKEVKEVNIQNGKEDSKKHDSLLHENGKIANANDKRSSKALSTKIVNDKPNDSPCDDEPEEKFLSISSSTLEKNAEKLKSGSSSITHPSPTKSKGDKGNDPTLMPAAPAERIHTPSPASTDFPDEHLLPSTMEGMIRQGVGQELDEKEWSSASKKKKNKKIMEMSSSKESGASTLDYHKVTSSNHTTSSVSSPPLNIVGDANSATSTQPSKKSTANISTHNPTPPSSLVPNNPNLSSGNNINIPSPPLLTIPSGPPPSHPISKSNQHEMPPMTFKSKFDATVANQTHNKLTSPSIEIQKNLKISDSSQASLTSPINVEIDAVVVEHMTNVSNGDILSVNIPSRSQNDILVQNGGDGSDNLLVSLRGNLPSQPQYPSGHIPLNSTSQDSFLVGVGNVGAVGSPLVNASETGSLPALPIIDDLAAWVKPSKVNIIGSEAESNSTLSILGSSLTEQRDDTTIYNPGNMNENSNSFFSSIFTQLNQPSISSHSQIPVIPPQGKSFPSPPPGFSRLGPANVTSDNCDTDISPITSVGTFSSFDRTGVMGYRSPSTDVDDNSWMRAIGVAGSGIGMGIGSSSLGSSIFEGNDGIRTVGASVPPLGGLGLGGLGTNPHGGGGSRLGSWLDPSLESPISFNNNSLTTSALGIVGAGPKPPSLASTSFDEATGITFAFRSPATRNATEDVLHRTETTDVSRKRGAYQHP